MAEEIEAVLAHELGHFRLHHVRQRLGVSALSVLAGLALLGWLARQPGFYTALGVPAGSPATALLLFVLIVPVFAFFATPLESWWSRRQERAADDFAIEYTDAGRLAGALVKLYRDNATTLTPDPVHSAFYDSHPPALERISRLAPARRPLARTIYEQYAFSCTKAGSDRYFPDRRESIALRSPCCAQALGGHCAALSLLRASPGWPSMATRRTHASYPWPPARRMRRARGGCEKTLRRDAILHRCKPGFAIALRSPCCAQARGGHPWPPVGRMRPTPGEPARRMRRALFFTLRKIPI